MHYRPEQIPATFSQLLDVCNYQQELLKKYEEYIEQNIVSKILEEDIDDDRWNPNALGTFKRITIPQSTFMLRCDKTTLKTWEWLKYQRPAFEPDYFIKAAFIEEGENNAKTD